jgi:hypothetical protein
VGNRVDGSEISYDFLAQVATERVLRMPFSGVTFCRKSRLQVEKFH